MSTVREIRLLVDHYIETRPSKLTALSLRSAVRAITTLNSDSDLSDQQLADMIAIRAVEKGRAVSFDLRRQADPEFA